MKRFKTYLNKIVNSLKTKIREFDKKLLRSNFLQDFKTFVISYIISLFFVGLFQLSKKNWILIKTFLHVKSWFPFFETLIIVLLCVSAAFIFLFLIGTYKRVKESRRWDSILAILIGLFVALPLNKVRIIFVVVSFSFFVFCLLLVSRKTREKDSFFLVDAPEENENNDWMDFKDDAYYFAEQVLQQTSKKCMVFGLDAPWGAGKSTYLNFCKNYWKNKPDNKPIVFEFEPLSFIGADDIFDKFANEFKTAILSNIYIPRFKSKFNRYVKLLKNVSLDFWGGSLSIESSIETPDALEELKEVLLSANKKMIVIIDDLDRLSLVDVKTILDAVKKSFVLPNISYILCYSTDNIDTFTTNLKKTDTEGVITGNSYDLKIQTTANEKPDRQKITEYFEKIISVKKTLVLSREKIKDYLITEIVKLSSFVLPGGETIKLLSPDSLEKAKIAIEKIFTPNDFEDYIQYLGDLRKVKRFLNILKMQINNLNLNVIDIDFYDLIHLFLVYINFPQIFRKIYITETDGAHGFFSLNYSYDPNERSRTFVNSQKYKDYLKTLDSKERFLVSKIFDQERIDDRKTDPKMRAMMAVFNGELGDAKNLERYLKLIVRNQKPQNSESYNFHWNNATRFIQHGESLDQIFSNETYDLRFGEQTRFMFFRILFTNLDKINFNRAQELMDYLLDSTKNFVSLETDTFDTGIRKNLDLYIVDLLDKKGWKDENGNSFLNSEDNIIQIAQRIFGEGPYINRGIIEKLSEPQRGLVGFFDLMSFRLYCCRDRGGSFYNLYRALGLHCNPQHPDAGPVRDLLIEEMREISQEAFRIFKNRYITPKKNIFDLASKMTNQNYFGNLESYIAKTATEKNINLIEEKEKIKNQILIFTLYQMMSTAIQNGVGVGFYDETGVANNHGISIALNKYLFEICFRVDNEKNPEQNKRNAQFFVDFLLINLESGIGRLGRTRYSPNEKYFNYINRNLLFAYWKDNAQKIKDLLATEKKVVYTYAYTASYENDLRMIFDFLDNLEKIFPSNNNDSNTFVLD